MLTSEQLCILLGYGLGDRGSIPCRVNKGIFFSSPRRPDRLWFPSSLLPSGYQGIFSRGELSGRSVKMATHLHLVPRLRTRGAIPPLPHTSSLTWCLVKDRIHSIFWSPECKRTQFRFLLTPHEEHKSTSLMLNGHQEVSAFIYITTRWPINRLVAKHVLVRCQWHFATLGKQAVNCECSLSIDH
jgi:hypothetical protein